MKVGIKIVIKDTSTQKWDIFATVERLAGGILFYKFDDTTRQREYMKMYDELPCLIWEFNDGITNKNVRIIED